MSVWIGMVPGASILLWSFAARRSPLTRRIDLVPPRAVDQRDRASHELLGLHIPRFPRLPRRFQILFCALLAMLSAQIFLSPLLSLLLVLAAAASIESIRRSAQTRARNRNEQTLLPFVEHLARGLRSGDSPVRALEQAARGQRGESYAGLSADCRSGVSFSEALHRWESQQQSGAAQHLGQVLRLGESVGAIRPQFVDSVVVTLVEQQNIVAEIRALSDQARYSALLMVGAPLLFCGGLVAVDSHARRLLLQTNLGGAICLAGTALDLAGFAWMQRLTRRVTPS